MRPLAAREPGPIAAALESRDVWYGLIVDGVHVDPAMLRPQWFQTISDVVGKATLVLPKSDWMQQGGRSGRHSEHLGHLLSELQSMQRTFPGATW